MPYDDEKPEAYDGGIGLAEIGGCAAGAGCFVFAGMPLLFQTIWGTLHAAGMDQEDTSLEFWLTVLFVLAMTIGTSVAVTKAIRSKD